MKIFTTCQALCFLFLKKNKFNEKNKLQSEKRRSRAHDVKNDRLRFFHVGFTQDGRAMEQPILKSSCSSALKEDFLFLCFDKRHFMQACSLFVNWDIK